MSRGKKETIKIKLLPPSKDNRRNSEGSIIQLKDGSLLLAYSHFYGRAIDDSSACIAGRISEDKGLTWSKKDILIIDSKEGEKNVGSPSFLRMASGELGLFYSVKNSASDCRLYLKKTFDEGKSWSDRNLIMPKPGYFVVNNDRVIQLSNNRILVPGSFVQLPAGPDGIFTSWENRGILRCFYSDDKGETWTESKSQVEAPPESRTGLQEPGVVELNDGTLMMWSRTDLGSQYISYSHDQGETWSEARPSEIISPLSPASIKRIPLTGDLFLIYNDHSGRYPYPYPPIMRTPLVTAISKNEGKTWQNHKLLETDPHFEYHYTSITFVDKKVILSYCIGNYDIGYLNLLQITVFDFEYLYSETRET